MNPKLLALPSIGRIVHFCGTDGETYAAIVTGVSWSSETQLNTAVSLATFGRTSLYFQPGPVQWSAEGGIPGTWSWPQRIG